MQLPSDREKAVLQTSQKMHQLVFHLYSNPKTCGLTTFSTNCQHPEKVCDIIYHVYTVYYIIHLYCQILCLLRVWHFMFANTFICRLQSRFWCIMTILIYEQEIHLYLHQHKICTYKTIILNNHCTKQRKIPAIEA